MKEIHMSIYIYLQESVKFKQITSAIHMSITA